jgi:hypothetical protein
MRRTIASRGEPAASGSAPSISMLKAALLTLHHRGQGVSPGGWVLRHRDFIRLHAALKAGVADSADDGIQVDNLLLLPPRRRCSLRPRYQPDGPYRRQRL